MKALKLIELLQLACEQTKHDCEVRIEMSNNVYQIEDKIVQYEYKGSTRLLIDTRVDNDN